MYDKYKINVGINYEEYYLLFWDLIKIYDMKVSK